MIKVKLTKADGTVVEKTIEKPKYGGVFTQGTPLQPQYTDEALLLKHYAPTMQYTNEELIIGDWAKGPSGTGETTWTHNMFPNLKIQRGWLAESWGLPQRLVEAITYHHRPMSALMTTPASHDPALSAIVYLANVIAQPVDDERVCNVPVDPKTLGTAQKLVELEYPGVDADGLAGMLDGISASLDRADLFRASVETAEPGGD